MDFAFGPVEQGAAVFNILIQHSRHTTYGHALTAFFGGEINGRTPLRKGEGTAVRQPIPLHNRAAYIGGLTQRGLKVTIVTKNLGYELRCADPIPFDAAYTRDLGYAAVKFLSEGGTGAMISLVGGKMQPMPFAELLDAHTHRTAVRRVDVQSEAYEVARQYMIRLEPEDFADDERVSHLAEVAGTTAEAFRAQFGYLADSP